MKIFYKIFLSFIARVIFVFPRFDKYVVIGDAGNKFTGNSKYLYIFLTERFKDLNTYWVTDNDKLIKSLKDMGGRVVKRRSLKGCLICLISKYWFFNNYLTDINIYLSHGCCAINLWHGIPLKKIEHDIDSGPLFELFKKPNFIQRYVTHAYLHRVPDYVVSTSKYVSKYSFISAFKIDDDKCINCGYPRNEVLKAGSDFFSEKEFEKWFFMDNFLIKEKIKSFSKVGIYMPTWRDYDKNFLLKGDWNFEELNQELKKINGAILLKFHSESKNLLQGKNGEMSNIIYIEEDVDIYSILKNTDFLVTDYSSIIFDYLLLEKPIVLYPFDLLSYQKESRGFYFDFEELDFAYIINNSSDLMEFYSDKFDDYLIGSRKTALNKFHNGSSKNSCLEIVNHVIN